MPAERPTTPLAATGAAGAPRRFAMPTPDRDQTRAGILYIIAAVFGYAVVNALIKWQVARYPLVEVVFFRCAFAIFPCLALVWARRGSAPLRTWRGAQHAQLGLTQFASLMLVYAAFDMMPLADLVAITFSGPLFVTLLSIPLLGEKVGRHRWAAVLVGFAGVLVMVRARGEIGSGLANPGALLVLASTGLSAFVAIATRRLTLTETTAALLTYQTLVTTFLSALLLPFEWRTPGAMDALALAGMGVCAGVAQYCGTQAYRLAPASVTAPFGYLAMLWALLFGYFIWDEMPTAMLLAGAAVVAASGVYIVYRETLRRAPPTTTVPAAAE